MATETNQDVDVVVNEENVSNPTDEITEEEKKEEVKEDVNNATDLPTEFLPPSKTMQDIYCDPINEDEKEVKAKIKEGHKTRKSLQSKENDLFASKPSMILDNWLFLGNARDSFQLPLLKQLGITHILNVTREVYKYHILNKQYPIKYCQLSIDDHMFNAKLSIYDYFLACKQFIDECNPAITNNNDNKILVHCAMGKSRSSTIVISYLMTSIINMTQQEMNRLQHIRQCLSDEKWIHETKNDMKILMGARFDILDKIESNLNEIQKEKLEQLRKERYDDRYMTMAEAYYFVKSCRELIGPNFSFCGQLKRLEKLYQNGKDTICDLPSFTEWDNDTINVWRGAAEKYPIEYPIDEIQQEQDNCSCVIL